jgi:hypothetical protein
MTDLTSLAKSYYRACETGDRAVIENAMAPGFTFTSRSTMASAGRTISGAAGQIIRPTPSSISSPSRRMAMPW